MAENPFDAMGLSPEKQARVEQSLPEGDQLAHHIAKLVDAYYHEYNGDRASTFMAAAVVLTTLLKDSNLLGEELTDAEVSLIYGFLSTSMMLVDSIHETNILEKQLEMHGLIPSTKAERDDMFALADQLKDLDSGEDI